MAPIDDGSPNEPGRSSRQNFSTIFPDGVVVDLADACRTTGRARASTQNLLVGLLPTAMKSLDQGAVVVRCPGRWVSPIFYEGKLRLIFVLPA